MSQELETNSSLVCVWPFVGREVAGVCSFPSRSLSLLYRPTSVCVSTSLVLLPWLSSAIWDLCVSVRIVGFVLFVCFSWEKYHWNFDGNCIDSMVCLQQCSCFHGVNSSAPCARGAMNLQHTEMHFVFWRKSSNTEEADSLTVLSDFRV